MKKIMILIICLSFFITGCTSIGNKSLLPEDIVASAVETNEEVQNYYIVSTMKFIENGKLSEEMTTKEWSAVVDGEAKRRTEVEAKGQGLSVSVMEGKTITMYQEDTNEVYTFDNEIDTNQSKSLRERTLNELDMVSNMYSIKNLGEKEMNGRKTYHLKGKPRKESTLLGDYEIWIDKENWIVVKSISNSGDIEVIVENKEIDFSPKIEPSLFELDLPKDVKIVDLNENSTNVKEITLEEVNEKLRSKALTITDENYKLEKIQLFSYDIEDIPDEIMFNYSKDGASVFSISILKVDEQTEVQESMGLEEKDIRESTGYVMDDIVKFVIFEEEDMQYNFIIEDETMTIDQAIGLIENMN